MSRIIMGGLAAIILCGCASSTAMNYKASTAKEPFGYAEKLQDDGTYILSVVLPGSGDTKTVPFEYWNRRAAELCGSDNYKKNIYKAARATNVRHAQYVYGGVGFGGGSAGAFKVEGELTCLDDSVDQ